MHWAAQVSDNSITSLRPALTIAGVSSGHLAPAFVRPAVLGAELQGVREQVLTKLRDLRGIDRKVGQRIDLDDRFGFLDDGRKQVECRATLAIAAKSLQ